MLLYVVLFIIGLIVAIIIPLLYHFFTGAGVTVYDAILPRSYRFKRVRKNSVPENPSYEDVPVAMGVISRDTRALLASTNKKPAKIELQFSGDNTCDTPRRLYSAPSNLCSAPLKVKAESQGRIPIREVRRTDVGKAYKVTRGAAR